MNSNAVTIMRVRGCGVGPSYATGDVGVAVNYNVLGFSGTLFAGVVFDSALHIAGYSVALHVAARHAQDAPNYCLET